MTVAFQSLLGSDESSVKIKRPTISSKCTEKKKAKITSFKSSNMSDAREKKILCPFLNVYKPRTASLWKFTSDLQDHGQLQRSIGLAVGADVTGKQQGFWKALTGHAPDLYNLDKVPGVSHDDLFQKHVEQFEKKAAPDGTLTIQDLVDIKKDIAKLENVEQINDASKLETTLLFLGSGGDLETFKVRVEDIKTFLSGTRVPNQNEITFETSKKVKEKCNW